MWPGSLLREPVSVWSLAGGTCAGTPWESNSPVRRLWPPVCCDAVAAIRHDDDDDDDDHDDDDDDDDDDDVHDYRGEGHVYLKHPVHSLTTVLQSPSRLSW